MEATLTENLPFLADRVGERMQFLAAHGAEWDGEAWERRRALLMQDMDRLTEALAADGLRLEDAGWTVAADGAWHRVGLLPELSVPEPLARAYRYLEEQVPVEMREWARRERPEVWETVLAAEAVLDAEVSRENVAEVGRAYGAVLNAWNSREENLSVLGLMDEPARIAEVTEEGVRYTLVADAGGLQRLSAALAAEQQLIGADTETTGLDPRKARVRLLSLAVGREVWVVDAFRLPLEPLWGLLRERKLLFHHALFDLQFLAALGFEAGWVGDTMLLSQLVYAGEEGSNSLAACCERELSRVLDKRLQQADWSGSVTREMAHYAAEDAAVLVPLWERLTERARLYDVERAAEIERRALPAVVWMSQRGLGFDSEAWRRLIAASEQEARQIEKRLMELCPKGSTLDLGYGWNWDSPDECLQALQQSGFAVENTADDTLAALDSPLAEALRAYRSARKRVSSYGEGWLNLVQNGRLYPQWNQLRSRAGRMSCERPNLQQVPREERYRACVVAPPGRVLVKADYSQIELRIAAFIAGEEAMIEAYRNGDDLHTLTAVRVFGAATPTKADRQKAKSANFGLLYGMGSDGLRSYAKSTFGVDFSAEEAERYRRSFFAAYPALRRWHERTRRERTGATRTLCGRRRVLRREDPDTFRLNTPVQGTGADGLKRALALLWERRAQCAGAFPVIACHDEIVVECDAREAEGAGVWLRTAMLDGMAPLIEPVPVEVETQTGPTWAL